MSNVLHATENKIDFFTLNVGNANSYVIYFKENQAAVIIDPGNSELILELLFEKSLTVKYIPFIVVSHGDMDHMAGLNEIIRHCMANQIKLEYVFFNRDALAKLHNPKDKKKLKEFYREYLELRNRKFFTWISTVIADEENQQLLLSFQNLGIECSVLYPKQNDMGNSHLDKDINLQSILLLLTFARKKIMYTGDLPQKGWESIDAVQDLTADVFQVPHHGGNLTKQKGETGAATGKILDRVKPSFALISTGNQHDHPLPEVVNAIVKSSNPPHLFCTRLTDRCSQDPGKIKQIADFYEKEIADKGDLEIVQLGNKSGSMCAGTVRMTIDSESGDITSQPSAINHHKMLKRVFNHAGLLCSH